MVRLVSDEVPRCDGPTGATTSCGGTVLKHRLQYRVITQRFDRVEQEESLIVISARNIWNVPRGGKRFDWGGAFVIGPIGVRDPSTLLNNSALSNRSTANLCTVILRNMNNFSSLIYEVDFIINVKDLSA